MRVDTSELDRFALLLELSDDRVSDGVKDAVVKESRKVAELARRDAPIGATGETHDTLGEVIDAKGWGATIGTETWYAHFIEGGTQRLPPRPFLLPALDKREPHFMARLADLLDDL